MVLNYIWENICGTQIPLLPSHFMQANPEAFEQLLEEVRKHLSQDDFLIELYAGMGVISLVMRQSVASTLAIEENKDSYLSFCEGKKKLAPELQHNCEFIVGDSEEIYLNEQRRNHVLILDPPRKGLSQKLVKSLSLDCHFLNVEKIVYISCYYPSLERDLLELTSHGNWSLSHASCHLFFPGTEHIETLVILKRSG